jgi:hypothetical protein
MLTAQIVKVIDMKVVVIIKDEKVVVYEIEKYLVADDKI